MLRKIFWITLAASAILAACGGSAVVAAPTDAPIADSPAPALESPTAAPAAPSEPTANIKAGLVATDPTTVTLAAGKPQLVEFFAFW